MQTLVKLLLFIAFFGLCISAPPAWSQENKPVKIGVLAYRGAAEALDTWMPTARYLSEKVPGYSFTIVPLDFREIPLSVERREVDFVLSNPSMYVEFEVRYRVRRLATMKRLGPQGTQVTEFGGVIFTRADRKDIARLEDLKGKSFMAVDESSFGGWRVCWRHLKKRGVDPYADFSRLTFSGTHDTVVSAVRDGTVDAGTVRTDILEHMETSGKITRKEFRIIDQQNYEGFPFMLSTSLYPEWPFAELRHTPAKLAERVAVALLNMPEDAPAAKKAEIAGWTIPSDYQPVHDALKELRVGPYRDLGKVTMQDVVRQYRGWLLCAMALFSLMGGTTVFVIRLNRKLQQSRGELNEARKNLETRVKERTAELEAVNTKILQEVEGRKKTEALLYQAKQDWEDTFNTITDMITIHDKDFNIVLSNSSATKMLNLPGSLGTGAKCYKYFHGRDGAPDHCPSCQSLRTGIPETTEIYEPHLKRSLEVRAMPRLDANGAIIGLIHVVRDITERKKMEESLDEQRSFVESSIENSAVATFVLGPDHKVLLWNKACEVLTGIQASDMIGTDQQWKPFYAHKRPCLADIVIDNDVQSIPNLYPTHSKSALVPNGLHAEGWYRNLGTKDRYILFDAAPLYNSRGELMAAVETLQDITESKLAEEALNAAIVKAEDEKLKSEAIIAAIGDGISIQDTNLTVLYQNQIHKNMLGNHVGEYCFKAYEKRDHVCEGCPVVMSFNDGGIHTVERSAPTDKGTIHVEITASPLRDSSGSIIAVIEAAREITARKKTEEEIRRSYDTQFAISSLLQLSLDNIPLDDVLSQALDLILSIPWLALDAKGAILLAEDTPGALVMKAQRGLDSYVQKECAVVPFGRCLCGRAAAKQEIEFAAAIDERHDVRHAEMKPHGHYCVPIVLSDATLGVINLYLREGHQEEEKEKEFLRTIANTLAGIIQRKRTEDEKEKIKAQLYHAQKMESIGRLAGGVAHDFNNMLTAIIGFGGLLQMHMAEDSPPRAYLDQMTSAAEKAADLARGLLAFSRQQVMNQKPANINEIIRNMRTILSRVIIEEIELRTRLTDEDLIVMADAGQLEQVLMNLATNARDAMPGGGKLVIGTESAEIDDRYIRVHGFGRPGRYALISFSDTGIGMDSEIRRKIFEPFFTTKEVGKGTGLGLAIIYGIIKQHNGYINVYSELGKGTTFKVYLPIIERKATKSQGALPSAPKGGTETILVVEDEPSVRQFTKVTLEQFGYRVVEAVNGEDGIKQFSAHKDTIQLLILDVVMPKKNGREVYEELRKKKPGIKVLFISGYAGDILNEQGIIDEQASFLSKPLSPHDLLKKVRDVLDTQ